MARRMRLRASGSANTPRSRTPFPLSGVPPALEEGWRAALYPPFCKDCTSVVENKSINWRACTLGESASSKMGGGVSFVVPEDVAAGLFACPAGGLEGGAAGDANSSKSLTRIGTEFAAESGDCRGARVLLEGAANFWGKYCASPASTDARERSRTGV